MPHSLPLRRRSRLRAPLPATLAVFGTVFLTSCAPLASAFDPPEDTPSRSRPGTWQNAASQSTQRKSSDLTGTNIAKAPPQRPRQNEPQLWDPALMVGLDEDQLVGKLGQPATKIDAPPGKAWHYQIAACAVDFYLYPDVQTRKYRILHFEVTSNDDSAQRSRACPSDAASRAAR